MRLLNRNLSNTLPLFALCAVLGGVIYLELQDWPTAPRQVAVAVPQAPVAAPGKADVAPAGFRLASLQSFAETTNRPLFRENRRPLEVAAPQADGEAGEISVVGIVLSKAHRVALMRTEAAGPITRWVRDRSSGAGKWRRYRPPRWC
jgi:hypothetical protein